MTDSRPILVTGATGYVGGRLAPLLLEAGYRVRAAARSLNKLGCRPWTGHPNLELVKADLFDTASLARACHGCRAAYYLVHSMNRKSGRDYADLDRKAAENFAAAATGAGLERIIYLGGLGGDEDSLSEHLKSRTEVGRILQASGVPTTFLRAAMLLGSGSASFEIMRYLADRLPVMITPDWVDTLVQPISIRNALGYLAGCLEHPLVKGRTFDIGGPEATTYNQLFQTYAREAGLPPRRIIRVPFFTPRLSSYWIHLVTPVPAAIAQPLARGLRNEVIVTDDSLARLIPQNLMTPGQTIRRALEKHAAGLVDTRWTDAGELTPPEWVGAGDAPYSGGKIFRQGFQVTVRAPAAEVWRPVSRLGGTTGWYGSDRLWRLRGLMDELAGGVGLRRGRRHPEKILVGDALDFWRVLDVEPERRLVLLAEMKVPGEAILEMDLAPGDGRGGAAEAATRLRFITRFRPRGLAGLAYWYAMAPFHDFIFGRMCRQVAMAAGAAVDGRPVKVEPPAAVACRLEP